MNAKERIAYLRGLLDCMESEERSTKVFSAIVEALDSLAVEIEEHARLFEHVRLVVSYGACGCTGGVFHDNYCVWGGTDHILPVDVYIPGCPPTPAQTIYGFAIALGLLGQKLHHQDIVEEPGIQATLRFPDVPYKVRTAIERQARLYSNLIRKDG